MKRIILILAILGASFSALAFYNFTVFRLVSTTPKNGGAASTSQVVQIKFSQALDPEVKNRLKFEPTIQGDVTVEGKTLTFKPAGFFLLHQTYTATLDSPSSDKGQALETVQFKFTTDYLPAQQLDKATEQSLAEQTDRLERNNPLVNSLPQETSHYKIEYDVLADESIQYRVTLFAILNRPDQLDDYNEQLKAYKKEALDFIKSKGQDPTKLKIQYNPDQATAL